MKLYILSMIITASLEIRFLLNPKSSKDMNCIFFFGCILVFVTFVNSSWSLWAASRYKVCRVINV